MCSKKKVRKEVGKFLRKIKFGKKLHSKKNLFEKIYVQRKNSIKKEICLKIVCINFFLKNTGFFIAIGKSKYRLLLYTKYKLEFWETKLCSKKIILLKKLLFDKKN